MEVVDLMLKTCTRKGYTILIAVYLFCSISLLTACSPGSTTKSMEKENFSKTPQEKGGSSSAPTVMDQARVRLDWIVQGLNAGFMVAEQMGFYKELQMQVQIGPGEGSGTTAQVIGAKSDDFGFADGYVVARAIAEGMPIRMVAGIFRQNPVGVIAPSKSGIRNVQDLLGKTVGIPPGSTQAQQWPAFVKGCGLDESQIRVVNLSPSAAISALLEGQVDAIAGYVHGHLPGVEMGTGEEANVLWYSDCDVVAMSNGIIVHEDLLESQPDLIRRFVEATIRGFLYSRAHPEQAVAFLHEYSDTIENQQALRELELSWQSWVPESARGTPLGWMPPEDWEKTLETLAQYGEVDEVPAPEDVYTNAFVPEGEEFIPPQP